MEKGEVQIISPASDYVFAYDYNGKQIWKFNYPNGYSVVPRPVYENGIIYVSSGYDSPTLTLFAPVVRVILPSPTLHGKQGKVFLAILQFWLLTICFLWQLIMVWFPV